MGGFTKMMLIGESMQVRAHSCCISFFLFVTNFPPNPNSQIQKSHCSNTFTNSSGGSLAVVFPAFSIDPTGTNIQESLAAADKKTSSPPAFSNIAVYGWGVVVESPESAHLPPNR